MGVSVNCELILKAGLSIFHAQQSADKIGIHDSFEGVIFTPGEADPQILVGKAVPCSTMKDLQIHPQRFSKVGMSYPLDIASTQTPVIIRHDGVYTTSSPTIRSMWQELKQSEAA